MILAKAGSGIRFNEHVAGDGETVFRHACKLGLEGNCLKAQRLPVSFRTIARLAQDEKRECSGSETRSGGRMGPKETAVKTRTHFAHRIDMLDAAGEVQEHLAGVEDYILAEPYGGKRSRGGRKRSLSYVKARE